MLYDRNELKNKIDSYMNGTISKEEIGEWAAKAYHDILTGGYIDKTKIVLYPFLKTLSNIHVKRNDFKDMYPCSEEEVLEIKDILHGEKDFDFQVEISIPKQIYII